MIRLARTQRIQIVAEYDWYRLMQIKELQSVYRAQPFQPFVVNLADGRSFRVNHPEFMALSPTGRTAFVFERDGSFEMIDVMLITSVKVSDDNAKSRRKRT